MSQDSELVLLARDFCIKAHEGQKRDNGAPYSTHPIEVVEILRRHGVADDATLAAGYLHDVLEDTDVTVEQMRSEFGEEITGLVQELTNRGYPGRSFEEKHRTLAEHARKMSDKAKAVKLADRLHNLSQMDVWPIERRQRYAAATVDLLEALRPWPLSSLAEAIEVQIEPYLGE